jgi:outer membrane protein OmpA-like peptidoglycan-associated protein
MPSVIGGFRHRSATLEPHQQAALDRLAALITANPNPDVELEIEIAGHADTTGPDRFNVGLSEQRALAARNYLIEQHGVPEYKIRSVSGRGESLPLVPERTEEDRALNRRVEIVVRTRAAPQSERPPGGRTLR